MFDKNMKQMLALLLIIELSPFTLSAGPINHTFTLFPDGTILYKAIGARLTTLSPIQSAATPSEKQLKFTFQGKWELNSELQGVSVTPEAGVVIIARTDEEKKKLSEIESMLKRTGNGKIDIYVLSRSVSREGITYASPETIRFN